jgi:ureidoacrylate peracid hydrolase
VSNDSALLVIDMQNGFCHPDGSVPAAGKPLADIDRCVQATVAAVEDARKNAVPVVFTRHVYRPGRVDEGPNLSAMRPQLADHPGLLAGSWDGDLVAEMGAGADDLIVDKARFDAFQWTSLDLILQGLGVRKLVVAGVVTNICVESTVRSGFMRDYAMTILGDACAAMTPRLHSIGLEVLDFYGLARIEEVGAGFSFAQVDPDPEPVGLIT